ncbi:MULTISPECIES: LacI family DNA-binding transcriptional regulator [Acidobacterium]|uniref:Transcriptional regulator, putative n=1 Tax=Acidobacterium capsulatum (strain ATCC 51196 / DSM 11244 / BCRC 80197 / JCM 7670 / NBRC 15755 / NCIMB 13165 / 161) TaxID=240015 RepID=C1F9U0_ACIC5|nr:MULTISPECIES: LacI family DNA-binding transcriptional regulator [Acidobacterium]ACO34350.1 Transcriptional regulator, putative [Acidobacterium capsulatum ATCC 51196]HCT61683.1 LacI family transcriptional regulator [Acidobacterium sp.]
MPRPKKSANPSSLQSEVPNKPISLRTLGEYLDLSPATISLVLNNAPGVRSIPQETRDRVVAAAKKFDYRPSFYARSLRGQRSFLIGVLVPELSDGYSVHILDGMEEILMEEGYFYLTASHRRKADLIEEYPRLLMDRSVEGFLVIDTALQHSLPLPAIAVPGHRNIPGVTNIVLDHRRAAELSLRHLHQLGHRRIAFMRGRPSSSDAEDRWNSLMAVSRELGIEVLPELTMQVENTTSTPELGFPITNELLQRTRKFTAIIAFNDLAAVGSIRALRNHGLRVPEDVSVVGFDDFEAAAYYNPSLTTIRQPLRQMGYMAARLLLAKIRGEKELPPEVPIVPELIIRESTLPPPSASTRKR